MPLYAVHLMDGILQSDIKALGCNTEAVWAKKPHSHGKPKNTLSKNKENFG